MQKSGSMDWIIQQVRDRADLVEIVGRVVHLKRSGNKYWACCPFHNEKTPSFSVSTDKNLYYCFGCGASGDVFTFLQEYEGRTFLESLKHLAGELHIPFEVNPEEAREAALREEKKQQQYSLNQFAADFFQRSLHEPVGRQALHYLEKDRDLPPALIKDFLLGYAPDDWHALENALQEDNRSIDDAVSLGLLKRSEKDHVYDLFRHRVMFPILGRDGRILAFGGRVFREGDQPKYLNSPESDLFQKSEVLYGMHVAYREIRRTGRAILCEGYMDVLRMHQYGLSEAIATLGTSLTEKHVKEIKRAAKEILFLFDSDAAGIKAVERALPLTLEGGLQARVLLLPPGDDPDSYLRVHGRDGLLTRIQEDSRPALDFWLDHIFNEASHDPVQVRAATERATRLIAGLSDQIMQNYLLKTVAARVDVTPDYLKEQFFPRQGYQKKSFKPYSPSSEPASAMPMQPPPLMPMPMEPMDMMLPVPPPEWGEGPVGGMEPPPQESVGFFESPFAGDAFFGSGGSSLSFELPEETTADQEEKIDFLTVIKSYIAQPAFEHQWSLLEVQQYFRSPTWSLLLQCFHENLTEGTSDSLEESLLDKLSSRKALQLEIRESLRMPFEDDETIQQGLEETIEGLKKRKEYKGVFRQARTVTREQREDVSDSRVRDSQWEALARLAALKQKNTQTKG